MTESNKEVCSTNTDQMEVGQKINRKKGWLHSPESLAYQALCMQRWLPVIAARREKERLRRERNGWIGEGPYTSKHPAYKPWSNMIRRALARFDAKKRAAHDPDCRNGIVGEWYNFQNFAAWWDAQHESRYVADGKWHIDKETFCVWSRLYSPDTCALIPASVNRLLAYYDPCKGIKQRKDGKWCLTSQKYGKRVARNAFDTMDEAYFARADLIRAEVIIIVAPIRHKFSERVYQQLTHGYWEKLRAYMQPSVQAVAEIIRQTKEDAAKTYQ